MRKAIAPLVMLFAVSVAGQTAPTQRELAAQLVDAVEVPPLEIDAEVMKLDAAKAAVREALIDLYASRFSATELAELLAFFSTPTGKKLARETPELVRESVEKSLSALEPIIARERDRLQPWAGTMERMRRIGDALERYGIDNAEYPQVSFERLKGILVPDYLEELPAKDAWGNDFYYTTSRYGRHYRIVSAGSDGEFEPGSREMPEDGDHFDEPTITNDLKYDFIYTNQTFMQLPRIAADQ